MRRNIFYDKINIAYGNRKNELSNGIFRRNLNYFKLRYCRLNSKFCVKRKLSHSDENTSVFFVKNIKICDRATKLDSLGNFVPLYFSLKFTFLLPLFSGAVVVLENYAFQ